MQKGRNAMKKRLLSILLSLTCCLGLISPVFALEETAKISGSIQVVPTEDGGLALRFGPGDNSDVVPSSPNTSDGVQAATGTHAASAKPDDTATRENVLEVLRQYDADAYHIMTAGSGVDFMTWFMGRALISGIETAVHETYHGYTHSQSNGFYGERIYLGDGKSYDVDYSVVYRGSKFTKTEEMSKQIPSQLQTFRYSQYIAPGASADANTKGVFGLLNEFSAYYWGLETMNSLAQFLIDTNSGASSWETYVTGIGNDMTAYAEFKYWTLRYMLYIKSANPTLYQAILDNQNYCAAYRDADTAFTSEIARSKEIIDSSSEYMRSKGFSVDWSNSGIYLVSGSSSSGGNGNFDSWGNNIDDIIASWGNGSFGSWSSSSSRSGLSLGDYSSLMTELKAAEYVEMDSVLKNAASKQAQAASVGFSDVPSGAYCYDAVTWAVKQEITSGTSSTTFSPNSNCTVAQILTFLWRASGSPAPTGGNPFSDVKSSDYYAAAAAWAHEKGIVSGKTFGGNAPCTRSMAVTYMWKADGSPSAKAADFTDVPAGADYARAVAWAVEKGVTSGTGAGTFSPNSICTRTQIVTFLYRDRVGGPSHAGTPEAVSDGGTAAFTPVPMKDLVNLKSL